jgi:hypothetical protein
MFHLVTNPNGLKPSNFLRSTIGEWCHILLSNDLLLCGPIRGCEWIIIHDL